MDGKVWDGLIQYGKRCAECLSLRSSTFLKSRTSRLRLRLRDEQEGVTLVIMALLMMTLLGLAGLAIDGSNAFYQQQRMQIAADAASLGGARLLALGTTDSALDAEIQSLGHANAAETVTWSYINNQRGVHVAAQHTFQTYFARLYGFNTFTVSAEAEGQYDPVNGAGGLLPMTIPCGCLPADTSGGGATGGGTSDSNDNSALAAPQETSSTVNLADNASSAFQIDFVSHVGNTWTYQVKELGGQDLAYWDLGITSCLDKVTASSPAGATIGVDSVTGFSGIKWSVASGFVSGLFSFSLNDVYSTGTVQVLARAGTASATATIIGPLCDGSAPAPTPTPVAGGSNVCLPTLDFETDDASASLVRGQVIDNEWTAWGVHVTTNSPSSHPAMIFDSANPSGNQPALGTPNQAYGGPGQGAGGMNGAPGQNSRALGKVLMISSDNNASNPAAGGGTLALTFDTPIHIDEVQILNSADYAAAATVNVYSDAAGANLISPHAMLGLGANSLQTVAVNATGVQRLEISLPAGAAIPAIVSCRDQQTAYYTIGDRIWRDANGNGVQDSGEAGQGNVPLELYVAGQTNVVAKTTTDSGGGYAFSGLPAGNYEVKLADAAIQPNGSAATTTPDSAPTQDSRTWTSGSTQFTFSTPETYGSCWSTPTHDTITGGDPAGLEPARLGVSAVCYA